MLYYKKGILEVCYIVIILSFLLIPSCALAIDPFLSPSAGGLKMGSLARAQEGINSKGNIIDIYI